MAVAKHTGHFLGVFVPSGLRAGVRVAARRRNLSVSAYVRKVLAASLAERDQPARDSDSEAAVGV
jgi:plasmid stability protein